MDKKKWGKLGQSTAEYATLFLIIVGAVTIMQLFLKRGQQAAIRYTVLNHYIASGANELGGTIQFEPYYQDEYHNKEQTSNSVEQIFGGGRYKSQSSVGVTVKAGSYEKTLGVNEGKDYRNETNWGWNTTINDIDI